MAHSEIYERDPSREKMAIWIKCSSPKYLLIYLFYLNNHKYMLLMNEWILNRYIWWAGRGVAA